MPVAQPGRWVKSEAKSLLGGKKPRTRSAGATAGDTENADDLNPHPRGDATRESDGSSRNASYVTGWRALLMGCVIGALAMVAGLWSFPVVAEAFVPSSEANVAGQRAKSAAVGPNNVATQQSVPTQGEEQPRTAKTASQQSFLEIVRAHHVKRSASARAESEKAATLGVDIGDGKAKSHHGGERKKESQNRGGRKKEKESRAPRRAGDGEGRGAPKHHHSTQIKTFQLPTLGDASGEVWRSGWPELRTRPESGVTEEASLEARVTEEVVLHPNQNQRKANRPSARLGAEATAAAAAIGLASGKQVGEARMRDVRAAARSALDAADGVTAKQERRDVRSYASATQKLAAAQSVDPAGDARSASREAATAARERLRGDTRVPLYDALSKHTKDPSLAMVAKVR